MVRRKAAIAALPLLLAAGAAAPEPRPVQLAQRVVREQVMVRVRQVAPVAVDWKEGKAVKCLPAREILGASLISQNSVDFVMRDRRRFRAKLENSCPALDYYYGFYITPNRDGLVCADRDIIRSRMGGLCGIDRLRALSAAARR